MLQQAIASPPYLKPLRFYFNLGRRSNGRRRPFWSSCRREGPRSRFRFRPTLLGREQLLDQGGPLLLAHLIGQSGEEGHAHVHQLIAHRLQVLCVCNPILQSDKRRGRRSQGDPNDREAAPADDEPLSFDARASG